MNKGQDYIAMIKHSVQASCHSMDSFEEFISNGILKKSFLFFKKKKKEMLKENKWGWKCCYRLVTEYWDAYLFLSGSHLSLDDDDWTLHMVSAIIAYTSQKHPVCTVQKVNAVMFKAFSKAKE